eukprot:7894-Heterococcus_DN1.PRE.3
MAPYTLVPVLSVGSACSASTTSAGAALRCMAAVMAPVMRNSTAYTAQSKQKGSVVMKAQREAVHALYD